MLSLSGYPELPDLESEDSSTRSMGDCFPIVMARVPEDLNLCVLFALLRIVSAA